MCPCAASQRTCSRLIRPFTSASICFLQGSRAYWLTLLVSRNASHCLKAHRTAQTCLAITCMSLTDRTAVHVCPLRSSVFLLRACVVASLDMSVRDGNKKRRTGDDSAPALSSAVAPALASHRPPPSHAQLVEWFLQIYCRGPSLCTVYISDPATGLVPPATLSWVFASPRTGSLILCFLAWPCRKAFTRICTALHRSTDRYWSFSERDRNVIIANSLREYFGLAPLRF